MYKGEVIIAATTIFYYSLPLLLWYALCDSHDSKFVVPLESSIAALVYYSTSHWVYKFVDAVLYAYV